MQIPLRMSGHRDQPWPREANPPPAQKSPFDWLCARCLRLIFYGEWDSLSVFHSSWAFQSPGPAELQFRAELIIVILSSHDEDNSPVCVMMSHTISSIDWPHSAHLLKISSQFQGQALITEVSNLLLQCPFCPDNSCTQGQSTEFTDLCPRRAQICCWVNYSWEEFRKDQKSVSLDAYLSTSYLLQSINEPCTQWELYFCVCSLPEINVDASLLILLRCLK